MTSLTCNLNRRKKKENKPVSLIAVHNLKYLCSSQPLISLKNINRWRWRYLLYKLTPDGSMTHLMDVGNSSAVRRYPIPQAADTPLRPIIDIIVRPTTAETFARSRTMTVTIAMIVIVMNPSKLSFLPNLENGRNRTIDYKTCNFCWIYQKYSIRYHVKHFGLLYTYCTNTNFYPIYPIFLYLRVETRLVVNIFITQ